jgi:hypothetical protein
MGISACVAVLWSRRETGARHFSAEISGSPAGKQIPADSIPASHHHEDDDDVVLSFVAIPMRQNPSI